MTMKACCLLCLALAARSSAMKEDALVLMQHPLSVEALDEEALEEPNLLQNIFHGMIVQVKATARDVQKAVRDGTAQLREQVKQEHDFVGTQAAAPPPTKGTGKAEARLKEGLAKVVGDVKEKAKAKGNDGKLHGWQKWMKDLEKLSKTVEKGARDAAADIKKQVEEGLHLVRRAPAGSVLNFHKTNVSRAGTALRLAAYADSRAEAFVAEVNAQLAELSRVSLPRLPPPLQRQPAMRLENIKKHLKQGDMRGDVVEIAKGATVALEKELKVGAHGFEKDMKALGKHIQDDFSKAVAKVGNDFKKMFADIGKGFAQGAQDLRNQVVAAR